MPRRTDIHSICLIGSGPIVIGQAAEFDYAGCQALKVLREDGFRTIVVNSNPATIMTDPGFADRTYLEPLDVDSVAEVLRLECPDALLPTMGGQTALNLARDLAGAGVLDELGIERTALVGLSLGGRIALELALDSPERFWALALVAPGLSGHDGAAYTEDQEARYEAAEEARDLDAAMEIDFEVWAPLGADARIRELWQATPEAQGYPEEAEPAREPAADPSQLRVPVLVVVAKHDPPAQQEVGRALAAEAPNAELVEVDSDHYLTIRKPHEVADHIRRFLGAS